MNLKRNLTFFCFIASVCWTLGDDSIPPRIIDQLEEDVILFQASPKNKSISIPCQAEGAPPLKYEWKKNGETLPGYNSKVINGTLLINNLTKDNAGEYQCFASNKFGTARSNSVFLREFDYFNNASNTVTEGNSFRLMCNFTVDLMNKEQNYWFRKQNYSFKKIEEDARMTLDPHGTLWISRVGTNDSGNYSYIVPMQKNLSHEACQIELNVKPSKSNANITFQQEYVSNQAEYAENNKSKKLYCIYDGSPSLKTVWKMNGTVLLNDTSNIAFGKSEKYLEIKNFQLQNQNTYSCEVTDNVGKQKRTITHRFNVNIGKPYFTQEPRDMQIPENGTAEFACKYAGAEDVKVEWTYNGIPIHDTTFYKKLYFSDFNDCTFTIKNASKNHTGNYGFKIFNKFGSMYKDVYLVEQAEPNTITHSPEISTTDEASSQPTGITDSENNTTDTSNESFKSTDGVQTGKVVTIVLVIASIILSIIVIFLIVMKCKRDPRYGEYELAAREANNGATSDLNPSQMQAESSTDHSNSNNSGTKKHRARPTRNNNATAK